LDIKIKRLKLTISTLKLLLYFFPIFYLIFNYFQKYVFSQLVKGGDISKTLDMKGREAAVKLIDVSSTFIYNQYQLKHLYELNTQFIHFCFFFQLMFIYTYTCIQNKKLNYFFKLSVLSKKLNPVFQNYYFYRILV